MSEAKSRCRWWHMSLLHRFLDWDCNHRYTPWLQRLHARLFHGRGAA